MSTKQVINSANTVKGNSQSALKSALVNATSAAIAAKEIPTKHNYKTSAEPRRLANK